MKKVAIVTGSARGIGRKIANSLFDAGYRVAMLDIDIIEDIQISPEDVFSLVCDIGDESCVKEAIEAIMKRFGRVDLVVNNAASIIFKPLAELSYDEWKRVMDTNLGAIYLFARYLQDELKRNRGSIINIASTRAYMSEPDTESYSASKGGVIALTHALAASLGPEVRVNAISPGWIDTRSDNERENTPLSDEEHTQHLSGRVGRPENIASLVQWLADDKNSFVTGQDFIVDGGMTKKMIYI